ncbi:hypothetical protein GGH17_002133 [Coemansia sp. RSA 788]|nr:hypothetical protein GGH17_002133 [Coemansia sp. RSA 788]
MAHSTLVGRKGRLRGLGKLLLQHRDINSFDLGDLPTSLSSPSELKQLNEGVLQLLPDLTDVNGRSLFIDQLVQQLDSSNPNSLNDLLMLGNLHPGPSPDPLLSSATTTGLYANLAPVTAPTHSMGFDLSASPEVSAPHLGASGLFVPGVSNIMSYPSNIGAPVNPTLTDLAGTVPALTAAQLDLGQSHGRIASLSPAAPSVPDAMLGRPIARPRGYSNAQMAPQMPVSGVSLYSGLYTPMQVQQAQQQVQQQLQAQQQMLMSQAALGASPQTLQKLRMPIPNAQAVDPMAHQARMQALMAYRAMGLQCTAPEDEPDEDDVNLSLDEWLNTEKLTDAELTGATATTSRSIVPVVAVEEPELEEAEGAEAASMASNPTVRRSIAVQKSFAKRAVSDAPPRSTDEPVSYLRRRSQVMAEQPEPESKAEPTSEPEKDGADRKELAQVAVQLLVRINAMYLQKMQEQKREAEAANELDDLERELSAMGLEEHASESQSADAQTQEMADRLAKLGLSQTKSRASVA